MVNKEKHLKLAHEKFDQREYDSAMLHYALVLEKDPNNKEARAGVLLTEMAMSHEEGAEALFDYYTVLKSNDKELADEVIEEIITSMDGGLEKINSVIDEIKESAMIAEDGITYADFKALVEETGDFKRTFENIMFSTRVVINTKEDFIDFLEKLVENGFHEMAANYIENAAQTFPGDERIESIYRLLDGSRFSES